MMKLRLSILILLVLCILSCDDDNPCEGIRCENGGVEIELLNGCGCDCSATPYMGNQCQNFDPAKVQGLLDAGIEPLEILNAGIPMDSLYGKLYAGGLIFYIDSTGASGFVAATEDQSTDILWGCNGQDIQSLNNDGIPVDITAMREGARLGDGAANTDAIISECADDMFAAKACRALGPDWFLPSRQELGLMYLHLKAKGHDNFADWNYWTSTEYSRGLSWYQSFTEGIIGGSTKNVGFHVRAAKAF